MAKRYIKPFTMTTQDFVDGVYMPCPLCVKLTSKSRFCGVYRRKQPYKSLPMFTHWRSCHAILLNEHHLCTPNGQNEPGPCYCPACGKDMEHQLLSMPYEESRHEAFKDKRNAFQFMVHLLLLSEHELNDHIAIMLLNGFPFQSEAKEPELG